MWRCFVRDQARVPSVAGAGSSLFRKTEQFFSGAASYVLCVLSVCLFTRFLAFGSLLSLSASLAGAAVESEEAEGRRI